MIPQGALVLLTIGWILLRFTYLMRSFGYWNTQQPGFMPDKEII